MSERLIRTFISIPIPKDVRSKKNMLYSTLEDSPSNINWVKNEHLHLTIKFLGNTPESLFDEIKGELVQVASSIRPFDLCIDKTGCFPLPERPRVLWLGISGHISPLQNLFVNIEKKMENMGFAPEREEYFPHITLARVKYPQKFTPDISTFLKSSYDPIDFTVDRVQFLSSELLPSGTLYTLLGSFPLGETL
jgi:2'-5' RNA ligase|tara:strand:+ start:2566 stop:3144 length:579 start_codon:yes stop_codon:yes gene_type:complete